MLDFLIMHKNDNIDIKKAQDWVVKKKKKMINFLHGNMR